MKKVALLAIMVCLLCTTALTGEVYAQSDAAYESKISKEVKELMEKMNDTDKISVYVILNDINEEEAMNTFAQRNRNQYDTYVGTKAGYIQPKLESIQAAITSKRQVFSEYYFQNNNNVLNRYSEEKDRKFLSRYSPLNIIDADKATILKLARDNDISSIQLFILEKCVNQLSIANEVTRVDDVRDTLGYTGAGVRIGQIEPGVPESTCYDLNWDNIGINPNDCNEDNHASTAASIMVGQSNGVAPDAILYSTGCENSLDFYTNVEWLLHCGGDGTGVNVINMSAAINWNGQYDVYSQWIDHIAVMHDVHFVVCSGNFHTNSYGEVETGVCSPGMAYNAITVGGFYDNNTTSYNDDTWYDQTCYVESSSSNRPEKPNLIAPAKNIYVLGANHSGTSFSTPQVTGVIAQLIDYQPALATKQTAMGAILLASSHNQLNIDDPQLDNSEYIFEMQGAGELDAYAAARQIVYYGRYWGLTIYSSSFPYNKYVSISSSNTTTRVAIFWLKRNSLTDHEDPSTLTQIPLTNLDLRVYDPNGNQVGYSTTLYSNYEIVQFNPTVYGTYRIKIIRTSGSSTKEHVGIAVW